MKGKILLLAAFLIVCFNLRTGFDSPDPLLGTIEKDMGLSIHVQREEIFTSMHRI